MTPASGMHAVAQMFYLFIEPVVADPCRFRGLSDVGWRTEPGVFTDKTEESSAEIFKLYFPLVIDGKILSVLRIYCGIAVRWQLIDSFRFKTIEVHLFAVIPQGLLSFTVVKIGACGPAYGHMEIYLKRTAAVYEGIDHFRNASIDFAEDLGGGVRFLLEFIMQKIIGEDGDLVDYTGS